MRTPSQKLGLLMFSSYLAAALASDSPFAFLGSAVPNASYPPLCNSSFTSNNPQSWASGQAKMTWSVFRIRGGCGGVVRQLHWHASADEWAYIARGKLVFYVASPNGLPWPSSTNHLEKGDVWYVKKSWFHGFSCDDPVGCDVVLFFNTGISVPDDNFNIDAALAQSSDRMAADDLSLPASTYRQKSKPHFEESKDYSTQSSPLLMGSKACNPKCPDVEDRPGRASARPAVASYKALGTRVTYPGNVKAWELRSQQFEIAETMGQSFMHFPNGTGYNARWITNANAILVVISGHVNVTIQGGLSEATVHKSFTSKLGQYDAAYIPMGHNFLIQEASGKKSADVVVTFDAGQWMGIELKDSMSLFPGWMVEASLRGAYVPWNDAHPGVHRVINDAEVGAWMSSEALYGMFLMVVAFSTVVFYVRRRKQLRSNASSAAPFLA